VSAVVLALVALTASVAIISSTTVAAQSIQDYTPTSLTANTTGFNLDDARRYLYHSYAAYCPSATLKKWNCAFCKGQVTIIDTAFDAVKNMFAFIGHDASRNEIIVSYRGTVAVSLKNWIEDIKFWKADTEFDNMPNARVAKGFFESWRALSAQVNDAVNNGLKAYPGARVVTTGHSLGGAMATLNALDFRVLRNVTSDVYTFGSPRVGNQGFFNQFASRMSSQQSWRMVNHRDIVPHLPPFSFDFHHVANEVWERGQDYRQCDNTGEDPSCSWSVILPLLPDSIVDHLSYMGIGGGVCLGADGERVLGEGEAEAIADAYAANAKAAQAQADAAAAAAAPAPVASVAGASAPASASPVDVRVPVFVAPQVASF